MNRCALAFALAALLGAGPAFGGTAKTYQVTGPVVDVSSDTITVMKGKDNWEIAKDASTKTSGEIKKGDKVTIMYRMTATSIESKAAPAKPAAKKK